MIKEYAEGIIRLGGVSQEEEDLQFKKDYCENILMDLDDDFVRDFYDRESDKLIDLKIKVLEGLIQGKKPKSFGDDYYKILEKYPNGQKTRVEWR